LVGFIWTSYQPPARTSTGQKTTLVRDRHPYPGGIRFRNPSKRKRPQTHALDRCHCRRLKESNAIRNMTQFM